MNQEKNGIDWRPTFEYLQSKGMYTYLEEGKLKPGDKIEIMASEEF
jgi:hypothetical protein